MIFKSRVPSLKFRTGKKKVKENPLHNLYQTIKFETALVFERRQSAASEWFICSVYARLLRSFEVKLFDLVLVIIETVKCPIDMRITNRKLWDGIILRFDLSKPQSTHFCVDSLTWDKYFEWKQKLLISCADCKQNVLKIDFYARSLHTWRLL